ncbi:DUF4230 domain-containing protein [Paenimyroides baculatum]|uniref:DUF4230 domain-containing protein n=1 Tax=Paenimyroides baculatum TaxID=2608000 RepID=A0A5M6CHM1_9FLAO|nr:DUF4230 domain-containing protein [Paenimyroides baculatum]KAA5532885.1 DUF4230 domain-containing protein [Paenimyroides baculatum]
MTKKALIFALICVALGSLLTFFIMRKVDKKNEVLPDTELIQQQMKNVSKLVVNEAKISQIYNYKDEKSFMNLMSFDKKALVVVNADVQIMYDLSKLEYAVDEANKIVKITFIPKEEIKINPDIKIYDVEESRFNAFKGNDYNTIQESVKKQFHEKIMKSNIQANAKNRLVSELSKFLVVTQSLGWTLKYQDETITNTADFNELIQL